MCIYVHQKLCTGSFIVALFITGKVSITRRREINCGAFIQGNAAQQWQQMHYKYTQQRRWTDRQYVQWRKQKPKKILCMIPCVWSPQTGKTNLWCQKVRKVVIPRGDSWLEGGVGSFWDAGNVLFPSQGPGSMSLLVKIHCTVPFWCLHILSSLG